MILHDRQARICCDGERDGRPCRANLPFVDIGPASDAVFDRRAAAYFAEAGWCVRRHLCPDCRKRREESGGD